MEMGNPNEVLIWDRGQIYINRTDDLDEPSDITEDLSLKWEAVGLVKPESGISTSAANESQSFPLWNHPPVERNRNFSETLTFTVQNRNPLLEWLMWPGSDDTELSQGIRKVGPPRLVYLAAEIMQDGLKERRIVQDKVHVVRSGETTQSNQALEETEFSVLLPSDGFRIQTAIGVVSS